MYNIINMLKKVDYFQLTYKRPYAPYGSGPNSPKIHGFIFFPSVAPTTAFNAILEAVLQDIPFNTGFLNITKKILR